MSPSTSQIPKKRGRPAKYASKIEKAQEDAKKKRARRQAQSTAQREIQFHQYYAVQQAQAVPPSSAPPSSAPPSSAPPSSAPVHQVQLHVLHSLSVLANEAAATAPSQAAESEFPRLSVLPPNETFSSISDSGFYFSEATALPAQELSPPHPPSLGLPSQIDCTTHQCHEVIQEDNNYFTWNDDSQIHFPSTLESSYEAHVSDDRRSILSGDIEIQQAVGHPDGNLQNTDINGTIAESVGVPEDGLAEGRKEKEGNDQEEEWDKDSDSEFLLDESIDMMEDLDSDLESDLLPDNDENLSSVDVSKDTAAANGLSAKEFLEKTWSHLCDCKEEEPLESAREVVFGLNEMAEYWQNLGVPDAIGNASLSAKRDEDDNTIIDWFSVLGGGNQQPQLSLQRSQDSSPQIQRTWDVDSIMCWVKCLSVNRGLYVSYFPRPTRNIRSNVHVFHQ